MGGQLHPDLVGDEGHGLPAGAPLLQEVQARLDERGDTAPGQLVVELYNSWGSLCVVALRGEMDMSNAPELMRSVEAQLDGGPQRMIVELSRLEFLDSCGIRALIAVAKAVKDRGGAFALAAPTAIVARVLEIARLADYMAVEASLEGALRHVDIDDATGLHGASGV